MHIVFCSFKDYEIESWDSFSYIWLTDIEIYIIIMFKYNLNVNKLNVKNIF